MAQFFVSCTLGAEKELLSELREFWFEMMDLDGLPTRAAFPEHEEFKGGIELECDEHLGYQINFFSKIANRVLLRVGRFEARFFDQFEKGLMRVEFKKFLAPEGGVHLKIESHKSRLNNEKSIAEAAGKVLAQQGFHFFDKSDRGIYIRIEKDRVLVSLDTSGEHLHRRGYALYRGEAPLRETLAARMVHHLAQHVALDKNLTVIDPFVGSGTILFECLSAKQPNFYRPYNWLQFNNIPKLFRSPTWNKNYRWLHAADVQAIGYDMDATAVKNCKENLKVYQNMWPQSPDVQFWQKDSFDLKIDRTQLRKNVWIVANPPYGIRLNDGKAHEILERLGNAVDGIVVLHPLNWNIKTAKLKEKRSVDFSNQGLHLKLSVFC